MLLPCEVVMVMVELPAPEIDGGLKATLAPEGCPVADKATAELKPPETVVATVDMTLPPRETVTELGDVEMVKSGFAAGVTVRETVAVCVEVPLVPVTVMV